MAYEDLASPVKGMIGVYFMGMELSRHGVVAVPTTRNVKATDMLATNAEGTKVVTLQVKTTDCGEFGVASWGDKEPSTYQEGDKWLAESISPATTKIYALVQVDADGIPRDYWIMPSQDVLEEVRRIRKDYLGGTYKDKSKIRPNQRTGQPVKDKGNWTIEPADKYHKRLDTILRLLEG